MNRLPDTPVIPDESLRQMWEQDFLLQEAHAQLAATSLEDFWASMPKVTRPRDSNFSSVVDMVPAGDYDPSHAVAVILPFEQGWRPGMAMGASLFQESLETPTRLLVFPHSRGSVDLSAEDLWDVSSGNFDPVAIKHMRTAIDLGVERIDFLNYSMGASVGAAAMKLLAVNGAMQVNFAANIEPANTRSCIPNDMEKAFKKSGLRNMHRAKNGVAVPAYTESEHTGGRLVSLETARELVGFIPLLHPSKLGKAAHHGFTYPRYQRDMAMAHSRNGDLHSLTAIGSDSTICTPGSTDSVRRELADHHNAQVWKIEGFGHAIGDHLVVKALLGKAALNPSTY